MQTFTMAALGISFRVITKKFKLLQYFSWHHFLRKNEIRNYLVERTTNFIFFGFIIGFLLNNFSLVVWFYIVFVWFMFVII